MLLASRTHHQLLFAITIAAADRYFWLGRELWEVLNMSNLEEYHP